MTMQITVDKGLTPKDVRTDIKEQAKAFKMLYSPERLRDMFADTFLADNEDDRCAVLFGKVLSCSASAYQGGTYEAIAHFQIKMTVDCNLKIYKIMFYIDYDGNINTEVIRWADGTTIRMWRMDVYKLQ